MNVSGTVIKTIILLSDASVVLEARVQTDLHTDKHLFMTKISAMYIEIIRKKTIITSKS